MQTIEEYRKEFIEDTKATEANESNGTVASFVKLCAAKLFEGDVIPEYTPCFFQGYGYKKSSLRVDGYVFDETDGVFYLLVALYDGTDESPTMLGSDAKSILDKCRSFALNSLEYDLARKLEISTEAYDLAALIEDRYKYVTKFVIILLTDMLLSERAVLQDAPQTDNKNKKKKRAGILNAEPIADIETEYRIWDISRFHRVFTSAEGREEIEIDFLQYSDQGVPCLPANIDSSNTECKSYICTIPGNVLADLYDEYRSRLLEGNVRSFLGARGVNKDIRNTVLNQPDMFFVYNNGLAATATETRVEDGRLVFARDLQIVNGGQTTATLSSARRSNSADLTKISVLMKLTQVKQEVASMIVPLISRSANSQNKINPADFFSTHEYHVRLEQMSRRKFANAQEGAIHNTHWFYERSRGQYVQATMHMTKSDAKKFALQNPKNQVVTKTDLAKVLNSWNGYPHIVSKGAESNFAEFAKRTEAKWESEKDGFNDNYFEEAIALVILYRATDQLIPKQAWYEKGYKANIVTYSVALLKNLIKAWYPNSSLNLQKIWNKQKCDDILMNQMMIIAKAVYETITSDSRPIENVTQWCKQEACWQNVKQISVAPVDGFETLMRDYEEQRQIKKEAKEVRAIDNTIDNQQQVLELGEIYWKKLSEWLKKHKLANAGEMTALSKAMMISQGYFPNEVQCKNLIALRKKAVTEGFPEK